MRINENLFHKCIERVEGLSFDFIHIFGVENDYILWGGSNDPHEDVSEYCNRLFKLKEYIRLSREIKIDEIND